MDPGTQPMVINQVMFRPGLNARQDGRPSGFYMTVGHITPPALSPGASVEEVNSMGPIPIALAGYFFIPLGFTEELRDHLAMAIEAANGSGRVD